MNEQPRLELRSEQDKPGRVIGYAAVFGKASVDLGGFTEIIERGAFTDTLADGHDVRALIDHDHSRLLGRTTANTLKLAEDDTGLRFEFELPDTSYARDLRVMLDRGDVAGCSFGFRVPEGGEQWLTTGDGKAVRKLNKVSLREVTITSIPAYPDAGVSVRVAPDVLNKIPRPRAARCRRLLRLTEATG